MVRPRLFALTSAALACFAGNSLLCKAGLGKGLIGPAEFTAVRVAFGAVTLAALARLRGQGRRAVPDWSAAVALFAYAALFSLAYLRLDAGIGALILFGFVQATMVGASLAKGQKLALAGWGGLASAVVGLALLTVPGKSAPDPSGFASMALAGVAWGVYSLKGRQAGDPLAATAANFLRAVPLAMAFLAASLVGGSRVSPAGFALAAVSGALTSGVGYSLWYGVVPELGAMRASIVQLAVPPLALLASTLLLGERMTPRGLGASFLILSGVGLALGRGRTGS